MQEEYAATKERANGGLVVVAGYWLYATWPKITILGITESVYIDH